MSKCNMYDTLSYIYIDKWEHKSIPQKGMLYISGRKSFIGQKDSIPVINIFTDELDSTYITKVSHPLKPCLFSFAFACGPPYPLSFNTWLIEVMQTVHILHPIFPTLLPLQGF